MFHEVIVLERRGIVGGLGEDDLHDCERMVVYTGEVQKRCEVITMRGRSVINNH